jgi:two-component system chemotaxis sensor kinase CheA
MVDYRQSVIPLIYLSKLFDLPDYDEEKEDETELVVIRKGDKLVALSVDDFIAQQEIVIKSLGEYLEGETFAIMGATILGDGQTALIIDTNALIK